MKPHIVLFALAASLAHASVADTAERNIRSWVDANGVTHYGDAPPPEAIKNGSVVLNEHGVVVRNIPRQMTPEEATEARRQQEEEARRRAQDSFLINTYTKVGDIERLRDDQLALIDSQIELALGSVTSNEQRLESLKKRMASFRPYSAAENARRLPDPLAAEVVQTLGERRTLQQTLAGLETRREETRGKFGADIARYQQLTNRPSIR
jgi:hypothetical protein